MIKETVRAWHRLVTGEVTSDRDAFLTELLAEDVVFYSPVVFTPQRGRAVTKLYLQAAAATFDPAPRGEDRTGSPRGFQYTKELVVGNQAVLEFETTMGGKFVNGVDIIECDDSGRIVEFRVMIRPLQAVQAVHAAMGAMLAQLGGAQKPGAEG